MRGVQFAQRLAREPGRRAPDLAACSGRGTAPFEVDVRRPEALGPTHSLPLGRELSPRGRALPAHRDG